MHGIDPAPIFVSHRTDGFGERLRALLNAMMLAKKVGGTFRFTWQMRMGAAGTFHAIDPVGEVFDPAFIARHLMSADDLAPSNTADLSREVERLCAGQPASAAYVLVQHSDLRRQSLEIVRKFGIYGTLDDLFSEIGFSERIRLATSAARGVDISTNTIAIHLRAGDIIYGPFRFREHFFKKACPYPLAEALIGRAREEGGDVILFGQDADLLAALKDRHGVRVADDFSIGAGFTASQKAIFDIVLMSRCAKIFAGNSGFALVAGKISGAPVRTPYGLLEPGEAKAWIDEVVTGESDARVSDLQKSYALAALVTVPQEEMPAAESLSFLLRASAWDPDNELYHLMIAHLLFSLGRDGEADGLLLRRIARSPGAVAAVITASCPDDKIVASPFLDTLQQRGRRGFAGAAYYAGVAGAALGNSALAAEMAKIHGPLWPTDPARGAQD